MRDGWMRRRGRELDVQRDACPVLALAGLVEHR